MRGRLSSKRRFPYEYGSDLHWLWGWGARIESLLENDDLNTVGDLAGAIFRPDSEARAAMMRFSIAYPHIIRQVDNSLTWAEAVFRADSPPEFADALEILASRIATAAATIAEAEASTKPPRRPRPKQRPARPRFSPPVCPKCGGYSRVASKQGDLRYLKCPKCGRTWKVRG